jgi:hypothetical protein
MTPFAGRNVGARHQTLSLFVVQGLLALIATTVLGPAPAASAANNPPAFSYSRYVSANDTNAIMYNDGYSEAQRLGCTAPTIVLDFGRPDRNLGRSSSWLGYGTLLTGGSYMDDQTILNLAWNFADGWSVYQAYYGCRVAAGIVLGTSDSYECQSPPTSPCSITSAAHQWEAITEALGSMIQTYNLEAFSNAQAGDDLEQPPGFDNYSTAFPFVQTFNNYVTQDFKTIRLYDYGTDFPGNGDWTAADVYNVAYGQVHDYPIPEVYTTYAVSTWQSLYQTYPFMVFKGAMTSCASGSRPPNCTPYGLDPNTGWIDLSNAVNQYMPYSTQISFDR